MASVLTINGKAASLYKSIDNGKDLTTIKFAFDTAGLAGAGVIVSDDIKPYLLYDKEKNENYISVNFAGTGTFTNSRDFHLYGSWDGGTTKVQLTSTALFSASGANPVGYSRINMNGYPAPMLYIGQAAGIGNTGASGTLYISKVGVA